MQARDLSPRNRNQRFNANFALRFTVQWTGTFVPDICFKVLNYRSPCSLDFNIHQLILSDLAASVGASKADPADPTIDSSIDLITSNVTTRAISKDDVDLNSTSSGEGERVFMVGVPSGHWCHNFTVILVGFKSEMQHRVRGALCEHIDYSPPKHRFCPVGHSPRHPLH
jgi:hypothetical protein